MAQSSFIASTNDNSVFTDSVISWADACSQATALFVGTASATTQALTNEKVASTWRCARFPIWFDTSTLPDNATITGATLNLRVTAIANGTSRVLHACAGTFGTGTIAVTDYSLLTKVSIGSANWPGGAADLAITITDLTKISKTAETKIMLISDEDLTSTDPAGQHIITLATANNGTGGDKPELVVDYSLGNKSQSIMFLGVSGA